MKPWQGWILNADGTPIVGARGFLYREARGHDLPDDRYLSGEDEDGRPVGPFRPGVRLEAFHVPSGFEDPATWGTVADPRGWFDAPDEALPWRGRGGEEQVRYHVHLLDGTKVWTETFQVSADDAPRAFYLRDGLFRLGDPPAPKPEPVKRTLAVGYYNLLSFSDAALRLDSCARRLTASSVQRIRSFTTLPRVTGVSGVQVDWFIHPLYAPNQWAENVSLFMDSWSGDLQLCLFDEPGRTDGAPSEYRDKKWNTWGGVTPDSGQVRAIAGRYLSLVPAEYRSRVLVEWANEPVNEWWSRSWEPDLEKTARSLGYTRFVTSGGFPDDVISLSGPEVHDHCWPRYQAGKVFRKDGQERAISVLRSVIHRGQEAVWSGDGVYPERIEDARGWYQRLYDLGCPVVEVHLPSNAPSQWGVVEHEALADAKAVGWGR